MKGFSSLYTHNEQSTAAKNVKIALLIYVAIALLYAAFCAAFVALYVVVEVSVYACFAVNFVATIAFVWYTVVFFALSFPTKRDNLRFFRVLDNSQPTAYRGTFVQGYDTTKEGRLTFVSVQFATAEGDKTFLLLGVSPEIFREGVTYDLQAVGNKLVSYKEFDND